MLIWSPVNTAKLFLVHWWPYWWDSTVIYDKPPLSCQPPLSGHLPEPWGWPTYWQFNCINLFLLTKALWASNCGVVLQRAAPCWIKELEGICWICFCCCLCGIFLGICCDCRRFCDSNIGSSLCFKGVNRDTNEWLIWGVLRSLLDITTNAAMDLLDT